jgi:magnesium transporter
MLRIVSTHAGTLHVQEDAPTDRLPDGALWLDLHRSPEAEEAAVERLIGLDIPTRAEAAAIGESARLYTENGALIMTAAVVAGVSEGRRPIAADITFLLTSRLLVTVRDADPLPFRAFVQKCAREPDMRERPETIFLALVESIIDRAAEILRDA